MMSLWIGKQPRREEEEDGATGSEVVAGNDDLLTEILLRLPVRSLLRFKSVSKHWLSLISNPQFCFLKSTRSCKHISGLLHMEDTLEFEFIPLDHGCPAPFQSLDFLDVVDNRRLEPLQYCNGLLLFKTERHPSTEDKYYVINPTTKKQHTGVSFPVTEFPDKALRLYSVALAFDPRKHPHFKLICLFWCGGNDIDMDAADYCVQVYSSETGLMSQPSDLFHTSSAFLLSRGIYWNGAISWIDICRSDGLYFNVDEERFGILPMPPAPQHGYNRGLRYYGESNDHLFLAETHFSPTTQFEQFDVYEMDREYSGWFVRFHVDLQPMFRAFPTKSEHLRKAFSVLAIVDKDGGENSFIVFGRPEKAILQFHLKDRIFTKLCDFAGVDGEECLPVWAQSVQFIESLHPL